MCVHVCYGGLYTATNGMFMYMYMYMNQCKHNDSTHKVEPLLTTSGPARPGAGTEGLNN